jgi:predicted transport protein
LYIAFRRLKNFASVVMYPNKMLVMLKLDPGTVALEEGFSRDVREIGHWGTGDLELTVRTLADLEKAKPLLERSYTES